MTRIKHSWILLIVITLIVPQITLAAWWNPLSWFNNWGFIFNKTDNQTQILEKRIEELERKLDGVATSTSATTTKILVSDQKQPSQTQEKPKVIAVIPVSTAPVKQIISLSNTPKTFTTPNGAIIDEAGNIISPPNNNTNQTSTTPSLSAGSRVFASEEIYSLISPSVVLINWEDASYKYAGSGFVINNGKYILTNAHVLESKSGSYATRVNITMQNGITFQGIVLGANKSVDLALIFNGNQRPSAIAFGSSGDSLKIGGDVYALGFPLSINTGLSTVTFTKGILSAKQNISGYSGVLLQHDAPINHGNSGGPLVNNKGEVIGVNTSSLNDAQGIYFAIPIQTAIDLIPNLSQYGQSRYEVYPIGSTRTINRSLIMRIGINDTISCSGLLLSDNDLISCDLYRNYKDDYQWSILENR